MDYDVLSTRLANEFRATVLELKYKHQCSFACFSSKLMWSREGLVVHDGERQSYRTAYSGESNMSHHASCALQASRARDNICEVMIMCLSPRGVRVLVANIFCSSRIQFDIAIANEIVHDRVHGIRNLQKKHIVMAIRPFWVENAWCV